MNVLLTVPWDNLGGVCNVVNAVGLHLRDAGHTVHVLLPGDGNRATSCTTRAGLPGFQLNLRPATVAEAPIKGAAAFAAHYRSTQKELRRLIGDLGVQVVNVHFPDASSLHLAIMRKAGIARLVTSVHGADLLPYRI